LAWLWCPGFNVRIVNATSLKRALCPFFQLRPGGIQPDPTDPIRIRH
jgi:hypothetical protein